MKENLFVDIDNNKAYILGFLWADGYLDKCGVNTTIKSSDFDNIYEIFINSGDWKQYHRDRKSKQTGKVYKSSTISTFGILTFNFLLKNDYKIKSNTQPTKILKTIPEEYRRDFYRGYIDGDGSFSYYVGSNGTTMSCKFNITSNLVQNWTFIETLFDKIKINHYKINRYERESGNSSIIEICNKWDIIKLGDYLYQDCGSIMLERKYQKFLEIKNSPIKTPPQKWTEEDKIFLIKNYRENGLLYCCEKLNRTKKSVYKQVHILFDNPNKWSKEDETFLLNNYNKGVKFCCEELNRNTNSIKSKYKKLIS